MFWINQLLILTPWKTFLFIVTITRMYSRQKIFFSSEQFTISIIKITIKPLKIMSTVQSLSQIVIRLIKMAAAFQEITWPSLSWLILKDPLRCSQWTAVRLISLMSVCALSTYMRQILTSFYATLWFKTITVLLKRSKR